MFFELIDAIVESDAEWPGKELGYNSSEQHHLVEPI